jgi:glycosyltransferase involved in cell wall biosynthesis
MKKIIRITTIPESLGTLLKGQLNFMKNHHEIIGVSSGGYGLDDVGKQEGIRTIPVSMTRSITPFRDLRSLFRLYKIFKQEKPDVVHTHTPKAGTLGMLAAKLAGVPHRLHTIAGLPLLEEKGAKRILLNTVEKITYACATLVLPNSFALEEIVVKAKFCSKAKLKVIGNGSSNGIDTNHYNRNNISKEECTELRKQLNIKDDDTVFLFIGRIVRDKGINELVEAFVDLNKSSPNTKLIIVGPSEKELDPIDVETESVIKNHSHIHETGWIRDVRPYYYLSDILTFPSYREGFPNVVLQASCMNLPCIVTDINGCNEIVTHNFNGLIIPTKNSEALRNAMLYLHQNPEKQKELANNARPNILQKYKRELVWEELLKLYNELN